MRGADLPPVDLDLVFDDFEIVSPEICRLDIVFGVCIKTFVRWHKFIELMDDQKNWVNLACVFHERVEGGVRSVIAQSQRRIRTIRVAHSD